MVKIRFKMYFHMTLFGGEVRLWVRKLTHAALRRQVRNNYPSLYGVNMKFRDDGSIIDGEKIIGTYEDITPATDPPIIVEFIVYCNLIDKGFRFRSEVKRVNRVTLRKGFIKGAFSFADARITFTDKGGILTKTNKTVCDIGKWAVADCEDGKEGEGNE